MSSTEPILRMRGICKSFPGVKALEGAELEVMPGEVHVLLGENGAGKSTLMKILCGQYTADAGEIVFDGERIRPSSPLEAEARGLIMIHQELNLVPGLTVGQNVFLGHEPVRAGLIDRERICRRTRDLLGALHSEVAPESPVAGLSVAEQQLVEIARALLRHARLLVMDEPTAALADSEIEALFEVIRALCAEGVPVIYISHRMPEIFAIGDRVTVLRDGRTVGTRRVAETEVGELIQMMVGRTITEQIPKRPVALGDVLLEVEQLGRANDLGPISLTLRSGEILGVAGLMGSGRTELARAIFGADPTDTGTVRIRGRQLTARTPLESITRGMGFITEDRKQQGLVLQRSVAENISLTCLDDLSRAGLIDLGAERDVAREQTDAIGIRAASLDQETVHLSGGNQQKVVLARWLAARCEVLLFDEPTRGIDVGAKAEIYELIGDLVEQGAGELLGLADRIAVMHEGALGGILTRDEATQEKIMELALGATRSGKPDGPPAATRPRALAD